MNLKLQILLLFLGILFAGCSKWEETPVISQLNVVNAYPNANSLKIAINNTPVDTLTFGEATNYLQQGAGRSTVQIKNGESILADGDLYLAENSHYSLYILKGRNNADSVFVRTDSLPAPEVGRAKIRFANLSPDSGSLSLVVNGPTTDTLPARTFPNFTTFTIVDAAQGYSLSLLRDTISVATLSAQLLSSERTYTFIAVGYATPPIGNPRGLTLRMIENR